MYSTSNFKMVVPRGFLTNFKKKIDFGVGRYHTLIWRGPGHDLETWPFFDLVPPTSRDLNSERSEICSIIRSRGRGYWSGSSKFTRDPLIWKYTTYWHQDRKPNWNCSKNRVGPAFSSKRLKFHRNSTFSQELGCPHAFSFRLVSKNMKISSISPIITTLIIHAHE